MTYQMKSIRISKWKNLAYQVSAAHGACAGNRVDYLDRVAAQIPFRTPHRLFAKCMLHQGHMVVLMHMIGLSQVVPV